MKVGSLFSGIGGFDLGLEKAGMQVVWQSEVEPYCCEVLKKHWPHVPNLGDIFKMHNPPAVDLICGGFPCQPFSVAGKRKGKADDRYLWPEMLRIITEVKPRWMLAENVPGIIYMELDQVLSDLEGEGYETGTMLIPACGLNAPHRRNRVWIIAYAENSNRRSMSDKDESRRGIEKAGGSDRHAPYTEHDRCNGKKVCVSGRGSHQTPIDPARTDRHASDPTGKRCENSSRMLSGIYRPTQGNGEREGFRNNNGWKGEGWLEVATRLCRVDDGLPAWIHRHRVKRLKALGNAIVPQIAEVIGRMIIEVDKSLNENEEE